MVVLKPQSEVGYGPPPKSPYAIISNIPGWDTLCIVRDGDFTPFAKAVNFYPRIGPIQAVRTLVQTVAKKLGFENQSCYLYHNPIIWEFTKSHVQNEARKENAISPDQLTFKVVDIAGHRFYGVLFDPAHGKAVGLSWAMPGIGLSIRQAEYLLEHIDTMAEVPFEAGAIPEPTFTPEDPAHGLVRQRIIRLLHHGAFDPTLVTCTEKDVFLYPTGMASVFGLKNVMQEYRPGRVNVELGIVFHNTHQLLSEESPGGWKCYGKTDKESLDAVENWLQSEQDAGNAGVAFAIVELPGNPTLDSVDLPRLKQLSEKFNFVLVVDDTIGSFGNIDVFRYSDLVLTSLTKTFSGRADVLGGSIVLNPQSRYYNDLSQRFTQTHRNELFAADAKVLLSNSDDYYERTAKLNANAQTVAEFLHNSIKDIPDSPVVDVQYPSLLPSKADYDKVMRKSTPELPQPGYGCLMTVNFESVDTAKAFYDNCGFYPSPHLGGHVTIIFAYNMLFFSRTPEDEAEYKSYGARVEGLRISVGLEDPQDLVDTLRYALDKAIEVKKQKETTA